MADIPCCAVKFWMYILIAVGLVAFAGIMAGLTLGLMSLGLVDLEVLIKSGRPQDRIHASKIFPVVKNQHLLLCTLLIGNSLAMESLPIFLDKLVPPIAAIIISVTLILMFGEILPQAVCTRYGMTVGATAAPFVRLLLILFWPIAYPISKVLDWMLGKGHSALLRRAELKTFVTFHGNEAGKGGDLTHDETTIIAGALELTEKTAKDAMTPISKAFCLDLDSVLDAQTMNHIISKGHSRVPIYAGNPNNIIGLFLVKGLLMIDQADCIPLRKMGIRVIPRVYESMPLYDILNEFQKGHSHIAVVVRDKNVEEDIAKGTELRHLETKLKRGKKRTPSDVNLKDGKLSSEVSFSVSKHIIDGDDANKGAGGSVPKKKLKNVDFIMDIENNPLPVFPSSEEVVGVITMEDVIEELLQEEILDETDEYVDIHNRIKINMQAPQGSDILPLAKSSSLPQGSPKPPLRNSKGL